MRKCIQLFNSHPCPAKTQFHGQLIQSVTPHPDMFPSEMDRLEIRDDRSGSIQTEFLHIRRRQVTIDQVSSRLTAVPDQSLEVLFRKALISSCPILKSSGFPRLP